MAKSAKVVLSFTHYTGGFCKTHSLLLFYSCYSELFMLLLIKCFEVSIVIYAIRSGLCTPAQ